MRLENEQFEPVSANRISSVLGELVSRRRLHYGKACGILTVNTQARRIGALLYVLGKIKAGVRLLTQLENPPLNEVGRLRLNLRDHQLTSGEITAARSSVGHYLTLAQDLHLVTKQGSFYNLTAHGQLLMRLVQTPPTEPYPLSQEAMFCCLAIFLRYDFIGVKSLFRLLTSEACSIEELCSKYQEGLLNSIEEALDAIHEPHTRRLFLDRHSQIQKWTKPAKYSDHLVSARINWFKDLFITYGNAEKNNENAIKSDHQVWVKRLLRIRWPEEYEIFDLVECYSNALPTLSDTPNTAGVSELICQALANLFDLKSGAGSIEKVRADIAALQLTSTQMQLLQIMAQRGQSIWETTHERLCGQVCYELHPSPRSTQAYVIRHPLSQLTKA